jgi:polysaccharide export outer membrane protein
MTKKQLYKGLILLLILSFFASPCPAAAQGDYVIGPEDVLDITVWGHDDLRRSLPVTLEGKLTFPLIGEVKAAEKTTQELETEIATLLGDGYIVNPQVTVTIKEYRSSQVFVMGEVKNPGTYSVSKENSLLFILSQAGGSTKNAGEQIVIIRPKNPGSQAITLEEAEQKKEEIIKVNLKDALAGSKEHNVAIKNGDSIVVPSMSYFFVTGEVKKPGQYSLERGTTVLMAVSIAGGLTDLAAQKRTKIIREINGKKEEIKVEMDSIIQPGDTIIVPERFF